MSDPLSIFDAARECADRIALRVDGRQFTFGQLAGLTRERLHALEAEAASGHLYPLVATNTLDTVLTLYALFERRTPVLLLHPRATVPERERELQAAALSVHLLPADAAAVLYTSGTTGQPRGAVLTRSAIVASALANAANLGWRDDDCWLLCMPVGRVGGLSIITRSLAARRAVALVPAFDVAQLPHWVTQQRITLMSLVPTMLALLLDAHPGWTPPSSLRAILLGGARAPHALLKRAQAHALPIVITYGCTETCSQVVATPYSERFDPASCAAGRPLPGARVRVSDGHIQVNGPMLMSGYLGEPARAASDWFDTGDLGEIDADGCLHVHARRTDLIVTGGENVYPAEVEGVLESCPGIAAAGVFGVPDTIWGQIVAALLVASGEPPTDTMLAAYLGARLAPHKRPRRIAFVPCLPQTSAGKPDRQAFAACASRPRALMSMTR